MELKEAVRQDGHDWIRDDVVVRMEAELLAEIVLLRKIARWAVSVGVLLPAAVGTIKITGKVDL